MDKIPVVGDFMSRHLITVTPNANILDAIRLLLDHHISGAPVVEQTTDGRELVGIITEKDCLSVLASGAFYGMSSAKVEDYMTSPVVTIRVDADLFTVADIFLNRHYRRLPVIDLQGQLCGIVSRRDILNASRALWHEDVTPPDPGYLSDEVKAKLGEAGVSHLQKRIQF